MLGTKTDPLLRGKYWHGQICKESYGSVHRTGGFCRGFARPRGFAGHVPTKIKGEKKESPKPVPEKKKKINKTGAQTHESPHKIRSATERPNKFDLSATCTRAKEDERRLAGYTPRSLT